MTSIPWNRINTGLLLVVLLAVIGLFASRAYGGPLDPPGAPSATDGVLEPGTPISSLPFAITASGYYYLTRNLTGSSGDTGITISESDVTLDLKGFSLRGMVGTLDGVQIATGAANITIRNGSISYWGGSGIVFSLPTFAIGSNIHDLHVSNNGGDGIRTGGRTIIHDVTSRDNMLSGITASANAVIQRCIVTTNGGDGINAPFSSSITECSVTNNGGDGISAGQSSIVRGNLVYSNGGDGVEVSAGSLVEQNTTVANGLQVANGAGVRATGLFNRITNNNAANNDYGFAVDGPALTIGNYAQNNGQNSGDNYGQVLYGPLGPVLDASTIDDAGANPHANFR